MRKLLFLLAAMCCMFMNARAVDYSDYGRLKLVGNQLCDQDGNTIQLHGVGCGNWNFGCLHSESQISMAKQMGANVLASHLAAEESENGGIDKYKIWDIKNLIDNCTVHNPIYDTLQLYLLIDISVYMSEHVSSYKDDIMDAYTELLEYTKQKGIGENIIWYYGLESKNETYTWQNIKEEAAEFLTMIQENAPGSVVVLGTPKDSRDLTDVINSPVSKSAYPDLHIMYDFRYTTADTTDWETMLNNASMSIPVFVSDWHFYPAEKGNISQTDKDKADAFLAKCVSNSGGQLISWCGNEWGDRGYGRGMMLNYHDLSIDFQLTQTGWYMKNVLVTDPIVKYGLYVNGKNITSLNCYDVFKDGTVSYNNATKTLTLNNANIVYDGWSVIAAYQDLTINCVGTNTLTANSDSWSCILNDVGSVTITGSGTLSIVSNAYSAIEAQGGLTITGGCTVTAQSATFFAISLFDEPLTIDNATLIAKGNGKDATINACANLVLNNAEITSGHTYDATTHQFLDAAGEEAKDDIIIGVEGTGLEQLTMDNARCTMRKMILDNQLYILRGNKIYNAAGSPIHQLTK